MYLFAGSFNIAHLKKTSNHNGNSGNSGDGVNIAHLKKTSNHNLQKQ